MSSLNRYGIDKTSVGIEHNSIYALVYTFNLIEKHIIDYLKKFNLSPSQFNALMIIKHMGKNNGLSQVEISQKLIISPSNMTRLLDKLTKTSLIERVSSENDRRVNKIKITDEGSKLLDEAWPEYSNIIIGLTEKLPKEKLCQLSGILELWMEKLDK